MTYRDARGLQHSGDGDAASAMAQHALDLVLCYKGDPIGLCAQAIEAQPGLVQAHLIQAHALTFSLHPKLMPKARQIAEHVKTLPLNEREARHVRALCDWLDCRFEEAASGLGRIVEHWPNDLMALMFAHQADFFSGQTVPLISRPEYVLAHCDQDMPGIGHVLGMSAFGHEEAGHFLQASELAYRALELNANDVWAIHAQGHVLEMNGRDDEGIAWYEQHRGSWAEDCFFAVHNWWHLALYSIDQLDVPAALAAYDQGIAPDRRSITLNLCDAAALLWRIVLINGDIDGRFDAVAEAFARQSLDDVHIFNDIHAGLSFAFTGRQDDLDNLLHRLTKTAQGSGRHADMHKRLGIPAISSFVELFAGHPGNAAEVLEKLAPDEWLMTGSRAQRELLDLTMIEALQRAGRKQDAEARINGKLQCKPNSAKWQQELRRCQKMH